MKELESSTCCLYANHLRFGVGLHRRNEILHLKCANQCILNFGYITSMGILNASIITYHINLIRANADILRMAVLMDSHLAEDGEDVDDRRGMARI